MTGQFRFESAHDWLEHHISKVVDKGDMNRLASITRNLMMKVDGDTIQGLYERDMDRDGYFNRRRLDGKRTRTKE